MDNNDKKREWDVNDRERSGGFQIGIVSQPCGEYSQSFWSPKEKHKSYGKVSQSLVSLLQIYGASFKETHALGYQYEFAFVIWVTYPRARGTGMIPVQKQEKGKKSNAPLLDNFFICGGAAFSGHLPGNYLLSGISSVAYLTANVPYDLRWWWMAVVTARRIIIKYKRNKDVYLGVVGRAARLIPLGLRTTETKGATVEFSLLNTQQRFQVLTGSWPCPVEQRR